MKTISRMIIYVLVLLMIPTTGIAATKVWIIAGQSNTMSGSPADVPGWCQNVPDNVEYWVESDYPNFSWISRYYNFANQQNFGPEVLLAYQLGVNYPNDDHIVIRLSMGGTNLAEQWCRDCVYYDRLLAIIDWVVGQREVTYKAFIWLQGEGDTVDVNKAVAYKDNLQDMVAGIRGHLGTTIPILIVPTDVFEVPYTYVFNVAQAQEDFCKEDEQCRIVSNSGLTRYLDNVHYTSGSQLIFGARIFYVINNF